MRRRIAACLVAAAFAFGIGCSALRAGLDVPPDMSAFAKKTDMGKGVYVSSNADATVTGSVNRSSMLPPDVKTGNGSIFIPAGALPVGSHLYLIGSGTIGARLTTPPGFNFVPWVTPAGGSKTDLPGFAAAPLLGTDGTCEVWLKITQTSAGVRTAGFVRYGATNGQAYSISINTGGTGASGALPTVIASDPNVDRTFGVDGFWGSGADAREYVKARAVTVDIIPGN